MYVYNRQYYSTSTIDNIYTVIDLIVMYSCIMVPVPVDPTSTCICMYIYNCIYMYLYLHGQLHLQICTCKTVDLST